MQERLLDSAITVTGAIAVFGVPASLIIACADQAELALKIALPSIASGLTSIGLQTFVKHHDNISNN